ncbi:hypothetical protein [Allosphingosinicella indica]|uniref:DUF2268 domain-containing protein n=1 Tax=Allosphingosinicella indica TaxID=941907 RepID=A0A1X7G783_9SPHN|nr:hypothetical protein [Allosphingosinicella indica]SMF65223.1 hypothetical protein SAMN06295910_1281 [Allosphingosinicella indica]
MNRRTFLSAATALAALSTFPAVAAPAIRTRWNVTGSEGFDAIAFLGPLSGRSLYMDYYADDVAAFAPRLPAAIRADVPKLTDEADGSPFGLLWPSLANLLSVARLDSIDAVIATLANLDGLVRPGIEGDVPEWPWLTANAARLRAVFVAMRAASFSDFRRKRLGMAFDARRTEVANALSRYDVINWQEKLTGRTFDPMINVVLLAFSKPHGAKMRGQTFLQAADYDTATTVRIAAHEMLHPPIPMKGRVATAALAVLAKDPLIPRIVRDHDPQWGYTTLEGMLNEDIAQALDQIISEQLGVARVAADRWTRADDGIHVLAAGLYGLLGDDNWAKTGGDIEAWIDRATASGRLAPASLHATAARVLNRPADRLWPVPAA